VKIVFIAIGNIGISVFSLSSTFGDRLIGFGILLLILSYIIKIIATFKELPLRSVSTD